MCFKPCQFKHSKECKALKHKTRNSWTVFLRLTNSNTEPSSPSPASAPERTNINRSWNMQTEKSVIVPNSAPARCVLCAQGARREMRLKTLKRPSWRVSSKKLSVMSYVKVNSGERNRMCIIIMELSLKVTTHNLLAAVRNASTKKNESVNHSLLLTELLSSFNNN